MSESNNKNNPKKDLNVEKESSESKHDDEVISFKVNCSKCGEETEVPFKPTEGRPIYCRTCYMKMRRRY